MRKFSVILLGALWAFAMPLSAQAVLGFHAGANIANLGGDDVEDTSSRTGLNIGANLLFPLGENVGLSLGASYSEKGAEVSDPEVDGKFKLNYLEFPVMFRFGVPSSGRVGLHVYGGGAVAFETKCEIEGTDGSVSVAVDCDEAGIDTKSLDFGLIGGAGVDIAISDGMDLFLDALYNLGLRSLDDSPEAGDVKNRAFIVRAGIAIPLG